MNEPRLKVLTYNIHKGFNATNQRFVLHEIKQAVMATGADIVFLQEVSGRYGRLNQKAERWPSPSQFEYIADNTWHHHAYGKNVIYESGHHGNAILSKYPLINWNNINVSFFKNASRSLLHGRILFPGREQPLHLICVHLGLFGFERKHQLATLIKRIESHIGADDPLIIAGDFNDWLLRAEKHFYQKLGISEVFKSKSGRYARSFPAWMPLLKMDRIYSRGLNVIHSEHCRGHQWRKLSDHTPLFAEFSFIN